jgi:uncharacterized protein YjbJ (UPF0337 family)
MIEEAPMSGQRDRVEGTWDEAKGKVKESVGDATDNEDLEAEGKRDQTKGNAEKAVGHVKDAGEHLKEGVRDAVD